MANHIKPDDLSAPPYKIKTDLERAGHAQFGPVAVTDNNQKMSPAQIEELRQNPEKLKELNRGKMRSHPLLDKKRYFSGIDKRLNGNTRENPDSIERFNKEQELQYQKRLQQKLKHQKSITLGR